MPETLRTKLLRWDSTLPGVLVHRRANHLRGERLSRGPYQAAALLADENYVGTIFGGSMYAAVDPVYMLMLIMNLGKDYIVWTSQPASTSGSRKDGPLRSVRAR